MDIPQSDSCEHGDQPGKTRTTWHPLLVRMLDYALGSAFTVREEVSVGKMPLRVDILLIRREGGQLSEAQQWEISSLLPLLNRFTLVEFKGPTDAMEAGDFAQLVGCSFLWRSQECDPVTHDEVSLVVLAPTINGALRDELRLLGLEASPHEPGIFRVAGLPFMTWLVETDVMAERGQPILSLVSRVFLNDRRSIIEKLARRGHGALANYRYMVQQVRQFRTDEDFAMQQVLSENLKQFEEELFAKMIEEATVEQRLRGLPAEERVRGLSLDERLAGLSDEEAAQLRKLLERKEAH